MCQSLRSTDMQGERIIKQFLINNFYERIRNNKILNRVIGYESIDDIDLQMQGIDTYLFFNDGRRAAIDEKCALKYINTGLSTFAFEIQWQRHGKSTEGWFINDRLQTDIYFLMWLKGQPKYDSNTMLELTEYNYIRNMDVSDLTSIELYAISKRKLHEYLGSIGLTKSQMEAKAFEMIKKGIKQQEFMEGIKFYYSSYLAEKPINLVIKKSILRRMAVVFEITPSYVKKNGTIIYETP